MSQADPVAVVGRYLDAINRGDAEAAADLVTEDFVNEHSSDLGVGVIGARAYRERLEVFLSEFAELHYAPEQVIGTGERLAVPYHMSATWQSPDGIGRPFSLRGVFVFTLRHGHIAHRVDYWDSMSFSRQVGLI